VIPIKFANDSTDNTQCIAKFFSLKLLKYKREKIIILIRLNLQNNLDVEDSTRLFSYAFYTFTNINKKKKKTMYFCRRHFFLEIFAV
jgi:hypothetical protein